MSSWNRRFDKKLRNEGNVMTKTQAAELQAKWNRQVKYPPVCEHLKVDVERNEDGYVTGSYRCTACGDALAR